ncbi:MAG: ABC transporter permease, partial [Pseudomonadota bacterium]
MDFSNINAALLISAIMVASVPILLAAMGEMVVEKAGVLNLGVEGMMIMGAVCGFAVAMTTGSPAAAFVGAALGGMVLSLVFGILTQYFMTNQVATGLALTLFGLGLSSLIGQSYRGLKPPLTEKLDLGPLSDIPFLGQAMFSHDWIVYFSVALTIAVWAFLKYSRAGLVLRAVGENHDAA